MKEIRECDFVPGPIREAVHEGREDHEDCLHCKLGGLAWTLYGVQVCPEHLRFSNIGPRIMQEIMEQTYENEKSNIVHLSETGSKF